jgi:hypothetical protein
MLAKVVLVAMIVGLSACAVAAPEEEAEGDLGTSESAYRNMNGRALNGGAFGKTAFRLSSFRGTSGTALTRIGLDGATLTARTRGGVVRGADLQGAELSALTTEGTRVSLRIATVETSAAAKTEVYGLDVRQGSGAYAPLCGVDASGNRVGAFALRGRWDPREGVPGGGAKVDDGDAVTFACRGYAIAKCVDVLGYRPWDGYAEQHAACVRVIRADYCGNGTSYTKDGNPVNVVDDDGIQRDSERWLPEAEWTPAGARCVTKARVTQLSLLAGAGLIGPLGVPACLLRLVDVTCTNERHLASGAATLVSEVPITLSVELL